MNGINKVIILGTLGKDPQMLKSQSGKSYSALSIATNRSWKDDNGEKEERTDWHRVTVWGKQGELCSKYLKKGSQVCIEGSISTLETEEEGKKQWRTFIRANDVTFISSQKSAAVM